MARQSCVSELDGKSSYNTVFIDTILDTHLAMIVSDVDTVSDLKKRIQSEHPLCFPEIGKILIHGIKVKRKGYFYHLSDSMFVRSAFDGFSRSWFLSVDASALGEHGKNQHSLSPGASNQAACLGIANKASIGVVDVSLSCPSKEVSKFNNYPFPQLEQRQGENKEIPSPCVSEHTGKEVDKDTCVKPSVNNDPDIPSPGSIPDTQNHCYVNYDLPSSHIECEVDESSKANKDKCNVCYGGTLKAVSIAKKKHKSKRKKEDTVQDDISKENFLSVPGPVKDAVHQDIRVPENPSEEADKAVSHEIRIGENNIASGLGSSRTQMSNEVLNETEVPKEDTECRNKNNKNGIDTECNESFIQALEPRSSVNKKHRNRKRSLAHDSKEEVLKVVSTSQKSDAICKESEEPKEQVEFNNDRSRNGIKFQHNKASEEAPATRPTAKKKQKGKERSGDESALKDKIPTISDKGTLKPENSSQHSLEDQQKIKYSNPDHSTEHFDDTDPPRANVVHGKRKTKKNSSNFHQTVVVSSMNDDEAVHCRIQGEAVQDNMSEDGQISKGFGMSKTAVDSMEIRTDTCREGIPSKMKSTVNSRNHHVIDKNVHFSDVNEPMELTEDKKLSSAGNIALDHCHKSEAGLTKRAKEGKEMSLQNDPIMLSEKCTPSIQNNVDVNIGEVTVASKVWDADGITVPGKLEKKRRKIRKAKDLGGVAALGDGIDNADTSESGSIFVNSHITTNCDSVSGNNKKNDNHLNQLDGENVQPEKMKGTSLCVTDRGVHNINADDAGYLEQSSKMQAKDKNMEAKKGKKSKRKQISTAKSQSDVLTKDQVLDHKKPSPSSDRTLVDTSLKIIKKNMSASTKSANKSSGSNLEPGKDLVGIDPFLSQINSGSPGSSQVPSNGTETNYKVCPSEANETARHLTYLSGDEDENHLEAPSQRDKINGDQHFAYGRQEHEAVASDDVPLDNGNSADTDVVTGKNKHKLEAPEGRTHAIAGSLRSTQQLYSKDEGDGLRSHPNKKVPKVHRIGQEGQLSNQSNSVASTIEENRRADVVKASEKIMQLEKKREPFYVSNSKIRGSKKMVQNKAGKAPENNFGGVASNTEQKKSLLAGAIFKNDSTSEDGDEVDDSNASTRTTSDNSFSSDYSDGESNTGSYGGKGLENGGRSAIKACLSGTEGITIDRILRSSSRYKKAKITASQLEESESQPIDFVPDSLVNL